VGGELPRALRRLGLDVRCGLPRYASIDVRAAGPRRSLSVPRGAVTVPAFLQRKSVRGVPFLLIDGEPIARDRGIYGGGAAEGEKFIFWSLAALLACRELRWAPDIVHAHDWHAAAAVAWVARQRESDPFWTRVATVQTVHNLGYAGAEAQESWRAYNLPLAEGRDVPDWAQALALAAGLSRADLVTTVSPSYASEIMSPDSGFGLDPILNARDEPPVGILNGIDATVWNPARDRALPARYDIEHLDRRARNKAALLSELGFEGEAGWPLLAFIGRLEHHKGVDLLLQALATMLDAPWRSVLLGTGHPELEAMARAFEQGHPGRFRFRNGFDEALSRRLYGSADFVVVPSRYEPCGLVQMIGMRYGAVPIVRATGGLRDTVTDFAAGGGTGFVFEDPSAQALAAAIRRALDLRARPGAWRALQRRGMRRNHSWDRSAPRYLSLYRRAVRLRGGPRT